MWIILLLVHLVGLVGYNLLLRRQARKAQMHPWVLATAMQTAIAIPALIAAIFIPPDLSHYSVQALLLTIVVVVLDIALLITATRALQYLEAGTYAVVYNSRIVIATVLAVLLLSEMPSLWQLIGGLAILLAIVVLRQKGSQQITRAGLLWGFGAALSVSLVNVFEKQLMQEVGVFNAAPVVALIAALIMWAVVLVRRYKVPGKIIFTKPMIALMTLRSVSLWGFVFALATGALVSVATFVSSLSVVAIVALGVLLLGEREYLPRKIAAVILAVAGLAAILFGS